MRLALGMATICVPAVLSCTSDSDDRRARELGARSAPGQTGVTAVSASPTSSPIEASTRSLTEQLDVSMPAADEGLAITRIERYGAEDSARVVVFLTRSAPYEVGELPGENGTGVRLYLDVPQADYQGPSAYAVGGVVEHVRVGQHEGFVRVVLDLREASTKRVFFLPEPFRLIIDVASASRGPNSGQRRGKELNRVVLDPGHGGYDPGAMGATGLMEKDVALDVALRAAPLIARELGVSTLLTREGDDYVPLDERVAKANAFHADLFVSIHCNASYTADSHGVMTFVLDSSRDRVAQQVAARENDASEAASSQLARAMRQVMDTATVRASHRFAHLLQRASVASLTHHYPGVLDGGVRRAGFYVLAGAQMPAVLFEASFISNPTEELRLESADYRQRLADGIVNAIRAYQAGL